jgi:hypothetical protein
MFQDPSGRYQVPASIQMAGPAAVALYLEGLKKNDAGNVATANAAQKKKEAELANKNTHNVLYQSTSSSSSSSSSSSNSNYPHNPLYQSTSIYRVKTIIKKEVSIDRQFLWWTWESTETINTFKIQYAYKTVKKGTKDGVVVPSAPLFKKRVATAHTHAAYDSNYENDIFSDTPGDKANAKRRGVLNYVATPSGTLRRYNPITGEDIELYNNIPFDPNHPLRSETKYE